MESANRFILKIKNKTLLGHIYAQKFLHPNCYKSKYLNCIIGLKNTMIILKQKEYIDWLLKECLVVIKAPLNLLFL